MLNVITVNIRGLLDKKKVTRYRAAKDAGIPYNTLLKLEQRKMKTIDLSTMEKLLNYFGCKPNDLFAVEE